MPCMRRADLAGQADAMGLAARERGGGPVQGQVADAHGVQEAQARTGSPGSRRSATGRSRGSEGERGEGPRPLPSTGSRTNSRDGAVAQAHGQALRPQARAAAVRAGRLRRDRAGGPRRPRCRPRSRPPRPSATRRGAAKFSAPAGAGRAARPGTSRRPGAGPGAPGGAARANGASREKPRRWASSSSASRTRRGP